MMVKVFATLVVAVMLAGCGEQARERSSQFPGPLALSEEKVPIGFDLLDLGSERGHEWAIDVDMDTNPGAFNVHEAEFEESSLIERGHLALYVNPDGELLGGFVLQMTSTEAVTQFIAANDLCASLADDMTHEVLIDGVTVSLLFGDEALDEVIEAIAWAMTQDTDASIGCIGDPGQD